MAEDCCAGTDTIGGTTRQIQIVQEAITGKVIRLSVSITKVLAPNHQQQRDLQILKQASELSKYGPEAAESTSSYCCGSGAWGRSADSNTWLSSSIPFSRSAMPHRTKSAAVSRNTWDSRRFLGCESG